jgi:hypothetical protein
MGQINLQATFDFSGFILFGYTNPPGRPNIKHITLTLQWIEASEWLDNWNNSPRPDRKSVV